MKIAIASGKGGTGKTLVATNLAAALGAAYVDCDVEGANGGLFLKPVIRATRPAEAPVPVVNEKCTGCGVCARACRFGAMAAVKRGILVFNELCHSCGACLEACPESALEWGRHALGIVRSGTYRVGRVESPFADGELATGQIRSSAVIAQVKAAAGHAPHTVLDCPPGCSCAVAEAVRGTDLCVLVTEPTPFGLSDLEKALGLVRHFGIPHAVILNRSDLAGTDVRGFCEAHGVPLALEIAYDPHLARLYAEGRLAFEEDAGYRSIFLDLADALAQKTLKLAHPERGAGPIALFSGAPESPNQRCTERPTPERIVQVAVVSGKGGTGKTSLAASLAALAKGQATADGDVDAANLHLLLRPQQESRTPFSGAHLAVVDADRCRGCGVCAGECRFGAITLTPRATMDPLRCAGCGLCALVCPLAGTEEMPLRIEPRLSGYAYAGQTSAGPLSRGELLAGGEASGKLVTLVRQLAEGQAAEIAARQILIDASPGTGCPVNASLTGCDLAIAVTEPTQSGLSNLMRVLDLADWFKIPAAVVINKASICPPMAERIRSACAERGVEVLGEVPFDRRIPEQLARGIIPAMGEGEGAAALARLSREILRRIGRLTKEKTAADTVAGKTRKE
ncbi:MAG: 4Fe-4S binding protein [Phycisphaerae bacterium]|nr:4Fe-4S binding protein [Phycisphaerae bacterium]